MHEQSTFKLILNSKIFEIPILFENIVHINPDIYKSFIFTGQYEVKSNVSEFILHEFINYLVYLKDPNIGYINAKSYLELCEEFQFQSLEDLIHITLFMDYYCYDVEKFFELTPTQRTKFEEKIAEGLDEYFQYESDDILNLPIQSLKNIFFHLKRHIENDNLIYESICKYHKKTGNSDIFTLLPALNGQKLTKNNLDESISLRDSRKYIVSNIDIYSLLKKIDKMNAKIEQKDKRHKQILDEIFDGNEFVFKEDYIDYKNYLKYACLTDDIELINWLPFEEIEDECGISFKIDKENKTAACFQILTEEKDIIIPRSINYESEIYIITTILNRFAADNSNIRSIVFDENSEIKSFGKNAFTNSSIETIKIPPNVTRIGKFCFFKCNNLKSVEFSPNSKLKELKSYAFGNSSIEKIAIPSHITKISKFTFGECNKLKFIEFAKNSELKTICCAAFMKSSIEKIKIPLHVTKIGSLAFYKCENLKTIDLDENSELEQISKGSFQSSSIEIIKISSNLRKINSFSFHNCTKLKTVMFAKNSNLHYIGESAFENTSIETFYLPKNVNQIGIDAFSNCLRLKTFQFAEDSELHSVDYFLFSESVVEKVIFPLHLLDIKVLFDNCKSIIEIEIIGNSESQIMKKNDFIWFTYASKLVQIKIPTNNKQLIYKDDSFLLMKSDYKSDNYDSLIFARRDIKDAIIPSDIVTISVCAFFGCNKLKTFSFHNDSKLKKLDNQLFQNSSIEQMSIPFKMIELIPNNFWFFNTENLKKIIVSPFDNNFIYKDDSFLLGKTDINSDNYNILYFSRRDITNVIIPANIEIIASCAFQDCKQIKKIAFSNRSQLKSIGEYAFHRSSIERIIIPSTVTEILRSAFIFCNNLRFVQFEENSEVKEILYSAFAYSKIESFVIPPKVKYLGKKLFNYCEKLKIIEINESNELKSIDKSVFNDSPIEVIYTPMNLEKIFK